MPNAAGYTYFLQPPATPRTVPQSAERLLLDLSRAKMKLRLRSVETNETIRIEIADSSSLLDLKTLIAGKLSPHPPIPPQSIVLSLNRRDELVAPSPSDPLPSLGLASGDLLFYSQTQSPAPPSETGPGSISTPMDVQPATETLDSVPNAEPAIDSAMEIETPAAGKSSPVSCFLKRISELDRDGIKDNLGLIVFAVHAVFLDSGFVVCNESGSRLPQGWNLASNAVSIPYTVPELAAQVTERDVKAATLKFSVMRNHVLVYGNLSGEADVYRLHLDLSEAVPLVVFLTNTVNEQDEKGVFEFWKTVKDCLCFPLLIDICQKNGLPLPPCFARLPTELKFKILELLPGVDVARIGCTGSEMRRLTADDNLWKQKTIDEFVLTNAKAVAAVSSWKDEFKRHWILRKEASKITRGQRVIFQRRMPSYLDMPRRIRFPVIGDFGPMGPRFGYPGSSARRNIIPHCNLGGNDDFMG